MLDFGLRKFSHVVLADSRQLLRVGRFQIFKALLVTCTLCLKSAS